MNPLACAVILSVVALPVAANPFDRVAGSWRGAVQMDSRNVPDAHSVGTLSMHIGSDGEVDAVHANGCKFSGIVQARPPLPALWDVDVRMKSCAYPRFNRRWNGHLILRPDGSLQFSLSASTSTVGRPPEFLDVAGTLQR